jgi:hypothetical protein
MLSGYPTALLLLTVLLEVRLFSSSMSHEQEDIHEAFSGLLRPLLIVGISATVVGKGTWRPARKGDPHRGKHKPA